MASKRSKRNPYLWRDGSWHSRPQGRKYRKGTEKVTLTKAPAGSYDPGFDATERAAKRGLEDLLEDAERMSQREGSDWRLARGDLKREQAELDQDVATQRSEVERGHRYAIEDMLRNYSQLATAQGEQQRAAGLFAGGAAAQAAAKRASNQAIEQTRANENRSVSLDALLRQQQRAAKGIQRAEGQLDLNYSRAQEDRNLFQIPRAEREFEALKQDLSESRMAQYLQGGGKLTQTAKVKLPKPKAWNKRIRQQIRAGRV